MLLTKRDGSAKDFENYFGIGESKVIGLIYFVNFLVHHNCFKLLAGIMKRYKGKFIFHNTSLLREFEMDDIFMKRWTEWSYIQLVALAMEIFLQDIDYYGVFRQLLEER